MNFQLLLLLLQQQQQQPQQNIYFYLNLPFVLKLTKIIWFYKKWKLIFQNQKSGIFSNKGQCITLYGIDVCDIQKFIFKLNFYNFFNWKIWKIIKLETLNMLPFHLSKI